MLSSTPMTPAAFYEAFLSILQVYGFMAVPAGDVVKILPDANARQMPGIDLPDHVSATSDEIVTQVIDVKNVNAAQLVPILRPMVPQYAHLVAYPASNILIISDRASNVNRMIRIIRRIDQVGDQDVEIVPLTNASAAEIVRVVNSLYQGAAASEGASREGGGGRALQQRADRRRPDAAAAHPRAHRAPGYPARERWGHARALPALRGCREDRPETQGADHRHRAGLAAAGLPGAGAQASPLAQAEKSAMIWADPSNNALVITAPPKIMRAVMDIIDKLDIRKPQVLVEAIIAEVDVTKDSELGVNWAAFSQGGTVPVGSFVSPVGGTSIVDLARRGAEPGQSFDDPAARAPPSASAASPAPA